MSPFPATRHPPPATRIAVVTDSTSDLDPELAAVSGITIVPASIRLGAGAILARGEDRLAAASPSEQWAGTSDVADSAMIEAFTVAFRELLATHDAVIAVLLSGRLGDACAAARRARPLLIEPGRVAIVDSRSASLGLGLQALHAAELARWGVGSDDIVAELEAARDRYHVVFSIESVEHLRRSGRIGRAAAMIADALQLKPLLRIDEGQIVPYERARTRAGAIAELTEFAADLPGVSSITVLYATGRDDAETLAAGLAAVRNIPPASIDIARIGPAVADHVGPGALGIVLVEDAE